MNSKSAKFAPTAQKGILCRYDGNTIYRVFLEKDYKVIRVKDLRIHKDAIDKNETDLPIYDSVLIVEEDENLSKAISNSSRTQPRLNPEVTEASKRGRGRPGKHAHEAQVLALLSNEALTEPEHIFTIVDKDEEDPLILLAKEMEKEGAANLNDLDAFVQSDIAEQQTYYQAMNSSY